MLSNDFGRKAVATASRFPKELFQTLDGDWQRFAANAVADGLGPLIPPILGIVLTRCARRDAIPTVLKDLRNEWADGRKKVWDLLRALQTCRTLAEATDIRNALTDASRSFSPENPEPGYRAGRVMWEILAAGAAGAGVGVLSGAKPAIGAVIGTATQGARNLPAFTHEFGAALFGRGAFDLARRVRRAVSEVEFDTLARLLSDAEKQSLGLK